jgi:hypothetical protein
MTRAALLVACLITLACPRPALAQEEVDEELVALLRVSLEVQSQVLGLELQFEDGYVQLSPDRLEGVLAGCDPALLQAAVRGLMAGAALEAETPTQDGGVLVGIFRCTSAEGAADLLAAMLDTAERRGQQATSCEIEEVDLPGADAAHSVHYEVRGRGGAFEVHTLYLVYGDHVLDVTAGSCLDADQLRTLADDLLACLARWEER